MHNISISAHIDNIYGMPREHDKAPQHTFFIKKINCGMDLGLKNIGML